MQRNKIYRIKGKRRYSGRISKRTRPLIDVKVPYAHILANQRIIKNTRSYNILLNVLKDKHIKFSCKHIQT